MKLTPQLRIRLQKARRDIGTRIAIDTSDWSDDQLLSALSLIITGLGVRDAAAVVMGDAVLENGRVDYDPGCAWIDFMLARHSRTLADCARLLDQWETPCDMADRAAGANVVLLPTAVLHTPQRSAIAR